MGLIDKARKVFKRRRKKGDLWRWAREPKRARRRMRRWDALAKLANKNRALNRSLGRIVQAKAWMDARTIYRKKFRHLKRELDDRQEPASGGGGNCGWANPAASWNPYRRNVPAWTVQWLDKSRAAGWHGVVISGVRTAAYSQSLCYAMCGSPTCPGRCAGIYSNHNMETNDCYPKGALDVSDQWNFKAIQYRIGSPLRNALPLDTPHFSVSGR